MMNNTTRELTNILKHEIGVEFQYWDKQYFSFDDKYYDVIVLHVGISNYQFNSIMEMMKEYRKKGSSFFIELVYSKTGLMIKYR